MGTNSQKKALAKAKRGIVSSGAMSSKSGFEPHELKPKELPCPHCDRIFKQQDRLKQHIAKQHADVVAEQGAGEDKKVSSKAALIIQQREQAKQDAVAAAGAAGPSAPTPFSRMSCKLPKVILQEFVHKKTDFKSPVFKAQELPNSAGWTCKLVLRDKHKPDKDKVFFWKTAEKTKADAEHRVAVVALAKVANSLPLQRLLPAEYKETFTQCEALEKKRIDDAARRAEAEEKRAERMKMMQKHEPPQVLTMSEEKRSLVESILKEDYARNASDEDEDDEDLDNDGEDSDSVVNALRNKLENLGFERTDALAASRATKSTDVSDLSSAIDWLCVHVPESRLPAVYAPKSLNEGGLVVLSKVKASGASTDERRPENADVAWLWERGFPASACEEAIRVHSGNRRAAHEYAYSKFIVEICPDHASWPRGDNNAMVEDWEDEMLAIEAICGEDNVERIDDGAGVRIDIDSEANIRAVLEVYRPEGNGYPGVEPPIIAFHAHGKLREEFMQATRELVRLAAEGVGAPSIYTLVDAAPSLVKGATRDVGSGAISVPKPMSHVPQPRKPTATSVSGSGKFPAQTLSSKPVERQENTKKTQQKRERRGMSDAEKQAENTRLLECLNSYHAAAKSGKGEAFVMSNVRANLPASGSREEVTRAVNSAAVVVLSGETGCGKSTQVPQFILESEIAAGRGGETNIIVTQPRRISAIGLAERVAAERVEKCGDVVGYSVRLESKQSAKTRLLFCTTGVLLRRLLSDPTLENTTHVVLDEVHERSVDSDLLLLLLRRVISKNPRIRIVLMSATADADLFDEYFKHPTAISAVPGVTTTQVHIAGFTHPVREYFLEDVFEMTGHSVGKTGPYAKRKQIKRVKSNADTEAILAEKAAQRTAERVALGLEQDEDEDEGEDVEDDVPDDWDLVDENSTYEVKKAPEKVIEADFVQMKTATQLEEERRRADLLAEATRAMNGYSMQTQRSIQNVDETILNYDAIEQLIGSIIRTELTDGPNALVPPPIAGTKPKEVGLGAILVFMPGQFEITRLIRKLEQSRFLEEDEVGALRILPLYGSLSSKDQRRIFEKPPEGVRKIVVATNIAETSVTIDDVRYVIDTGRAKEMQYDSLRGLSVLADTWVSQAAAKQRRGRSGRTAPGARFAMFSRAQFANMSPQQPPEMLRTPLQHLCLNIKAMSDEPVAQTLGAALTPPEAQSVGAALDELRALRAFDADENLTPLGQHLAQMPVDARVGKMLLFGALLGCLDPILTIAGSMSGRPLFYSPKDNRDAAEKAKQSLSSSKSDHLTMVAAYKGWAKAKAQGKPFERRFCEEYFLSQQALEAVQASRVDYASILADLGFVRREYINNMRRYGSGGTEADSNAEVKRVIKAALVAGFYPHVLRVKHPETKYTQTTSGAIAKAANSRELKYYSKDIGRVFLHPASVNFHCGKYESRWLVYSERVETAKVYIRDNTMVGAYALLLFGGDISVAHDKGIVRVDDWATFQAPARIGVLIKELRARVDQLLLDRINHPSAALASTPVVRALLELLASEGH